MASVSKVSLGDRYSRLVVIERAGLDDDKGVRWMCRCDCGAEKVVSGSKLRKGDIKSCGCYRKERLTVHGDNRRDVRAPEHRIWGAMIGRCTRTSDKRWADYGGRGIKVCAKWSDYTAFIADMGRRPTPKHTIDRIDPNGNYQPGNVRWATMAEQQRNRRNNHNIEWNGKSMTAAEWERELGLGKGRLHDRLKGLGWSVEKAMTTP